MSAKLIRALLGLQDIEQAAAGGTVNRTVSVDGVSSVYTIDRLNASNFPILATATADQVAAAGGAATYPGPAIGEIAGRVRAGVADVAALAAIPEANAVDVQAVAVASVKAWFFWSAASVAADDGVSVIAPTDTTGAGRWLKQTAYTADVSVAVYADVAALQATPAPADNTLHLVEGEGLYQFDAASATAENLPYVVNPASGAGKFLMRYRDRSALKGSEITVSATNSNDIATDLDLKAGTAVIGRTKLSTAPASSSDPIAAGTNDPRIPTQSENDALVGTSGTPSSSNKYVTDADTRLAPSGTTGPGILSGNRKIQSGSGSLNGSNSLSVTFSSAFAAAPVAIAIYNNGNNSTGYMVVVSNISATAVTFQVFRYDSTSNPTGGTLYWIAIGS